MSGHHKAVMLLTRDEAPFVAMLRALGEIGILHTARSTRVDEYRDRAFARIVTVCDAAANNYPMWLGKRRRVHLGFPNPVKPAGSEEAAMVVIRQVCGDIARRVMGSLGQAQAWQVS